MGAEYNFRSGGCVRSLRRAGVSGATRSSVLQLCDENDTQQHTHRKVSPFTYVAISIGCLDSFSGVKHK